MDEKKEVKCEITIDVIGIGKAVKTGMIFLKKICLPAAEELGLYIQDRVANWRQRNIAEILNRSEELVLRRDDFDNIQIHPRIVSKIIEEGSWADLKEIQEMWAGLLASSCNIRGDDSDMIFINILSQLSSSEVIILNIACMECEKNCSESGLITALTFETNTEDLMRRANVLDIHQLD